MNYAVISQFPSHFLVKETLSSRYAGGRRPEQWDERRPGKDVVRAADGRVIKLYSDGQQSPPRPGWTIVVINGNAEDGYRWTLHGMVSAAPAKH